MAGDPYWYDNVKLLLPMTGANNSTTFTDLERVPKAVIANGGAKIVTGVADPFGGSDGVAYFDGSGDYLSSANSSDYNIQAAPFTIDFFMMLTGNAPSGGAYTIFSKGTGLASIGSLWLYVSASRGSVTLALSNGSAFIYSSWTYTFLLNTFYFIEINRIGSVLRCFINGEFMGEKSNYATINTVTAELQIGMFASSQHPFLGYMSNFRLTNGVARHTASFTKPDAPFPNYNAQLIGTLDETLAATTFVAEAHHASDGVLSGRKVFTGSSFAVDIKTPEKAHYLTVKPDMGTNWQASTAYALDQKVFPSNHVATPYYYKRLIAGTSGSTEPTWPTTPGGKCDDGSVTDAWEMVERLVQPITHGPLIPS